MDGERDCFLIGHYEIDACSQTAPMSVGLVKSGCDASALCKMPDEMWRARFFLQKIEEHEFQEDDAPEWKKESIFGLKYDHEEKSISIIQIYSAATLERTKERHEVFHRKFSAESNETLFWAFCVGPDYEEDYLPKLFSLRYGTRREWENLVNNEWEGLVNN